MNVRKSQRFVVLASNHDQAVFFGRDLMLVAHGAPALLTAAPGKRSLGGEILKFPLSPSFGSRSCCRPSSFSSRAPSCTCFCLTTAATTRNSPTRTSSWPTARRWLEVGSLCFPFWHPQGNEIARHDREIQAGTGRDDDRVS
jgi:hypothetical protein